MTHPPIKPDEFERSLVATDIQVALNADRLARLEVDVKDSRSALALIQEGLNAMDRTLFTMGQTMAGINVFTDDERHQLRALLSSVSGEKDRAEQRRRDITLAVIGFVSSVILLLIGAVVTYKVSH